MLHLAILGLIIIVNFCIAYLVYISNPKNKNNKFFVFFVLSLLFWVIFNYLSDADKDYSRVWIWLRMTFIFPAIFVALLLYFSIIFPKIEKVKYIYKLTITGSCALICLLCLTRQIIYDFIISDKEVEVVFGGLAILYVIYFVLLFVLSIVNLARKYFKAKDVEKVQIGFLSLGIALFVAVATLTNLIIPFLFQSFTLSVYGPYSFVIFIIFLAYAITKHGLFNIRIIATEIFSFLIALTSFLNIFYFENLKDLLLRFFLFGITILFAFLLIKSVLKTSKQNELISKLNIQLNKKNKYLDELLKMKSDFLHIASHQLKTPISIVRGYLSMILDGSYKGEKVKDALSKALLNVERLNETVKDFLDASDLEGEAIFLKKGKVDLMNEIREIVKLKEPLVKEKNLKIKIIEPPEKVPTIETSVDKIGDVISNLIDNAIYYTPKGEITIECKPENNYVLMIVRDQGIGIDKNEAKQLFNKFSRGNRAILLRPDGSGLGLFIIKKVLDNTGAKIWIESEGQGKGTSFYIKFPIKK